MLFQDYSPLDAGQDGGDVVRRAPSVLEDVETDLAGGIDVRMEHLGDELDTWRFTRVRFFELQHQFERAVLVGSVGRADDDGVPGELSVLTKVAVNIYKGCIVILESQQRRGNVPAHHIVLNRGRGDSGWRIRLHPLSGR